MAHTSNKEGTNKAGKASVNNRDWSRTSENLLFSADSSRGYATVVQDSGFAVRKEPPSCSTEHKSLQKIFPLLLLQCCLHYCYCHCYYCHKYNCYNHNDAAAAATITTLLLLLLLLLLILYYFYSNTITTNISLLLQLLQPYYYYCTTTTTLLLLLLLY
jgi:hypothetical protein